MGATLTIRLPQQERDRLQRMAEQVGSTPSAVVRSLIRQATVIPAVAPGPLVDMEGQINAARHSDG
jgi:predicted transcriptional regulator